MKPQINSSGDISLETTTSWQLLGMPKVTDTRGNLTYIEGLKHIPFEIARVYYIYDVPTGALRAGHAHKHLEQVYFALSGSFTVHLDDGNQRESVFLHRQHVGLYIPPGVWRTIDDFSGGAVLLVLASKPYEESDYIRSHDAFLEYLNNQQSSSTGLGV